MNPYLELLPIVADRWWQVDIVTRSVRDADGRCPLCALANQVDSDVRFDIAAGLALSEAGFGYEGFGLAPVSMAASAVFNAADQVNHPLRPALMAALGMTEEA